MVAYIQAVVDNQAVVGTQEVGSQFAEDMTQVADKQALLTVADKQALLTVADKQALLTVADKQVLLMEGMILEGADNLV